MQFATDVITKSVVPTIWKFAYIATRLGRDATAIYNSVAGLTPPPNQSYGRYFDSGNPLLQFQPFAGSVDDMIGQGVVLRESLQNALQSLVDTARAQDLSALAPAVYAAYGALAACCARPLDTIHITGILAGFKPPPLNAGTDTIGDQITSLAAMTAMVVRVAALVTMATATSQYNPTSSQDAIDLRNQVCAMIDDETLRLATVYDDADVASLTSLRVAVATDLDNRGRVLRPVTSLSFSTNLPSLVLAQKIYQDDGADMEPDLVARNNPINAGFMQLQVEALSP